jgi:hypothetical protein
MNINFLVRNFFPKCILNIYLTRIFFIYLQSLNSKFSKYILLSECKLPSQTDS